MVTTETVSAMVVVFAPAEMAAEARAGARSDRREDGGLHRLLEKRTLDAQS
jgi:hypothetical protein